MKTTVLKRTQHKRIYFKIREPEVKALHGDIDISFKRKAFKLEFQISQIYIEDLTFLILYIRCWNVFIKEIIYW